MTYPQIILISISTKYLLKFWTGEITLVYLPKLTNVITTCDEKLLKFVNVIKTENSK